MYRTVTELNDTELRELKRNYLDMHLMEVEGRCISTKEECDIDKYITDKEIFEYYSATHFINDDFWCNIM